jgi:hypothetical protein
VSSDGDLLVFLRRDATSADAVAVAVNRGASPARARVPLPQEWREREVADLLAGAAVTFPGDAVEVEVPARGAVILAAR